MDVRLAKNYTILFLIILNLVLFGVKIIVAKDYKITSKAEANIINYLKSKDVSINTKIPLSYKPMKSLTIGNVLHNELFLQEIFFDNSDDVTRIINFNDTIFNKGDKTLTLNNHFVKFTDKEKKDITFTKQNMLKITNSYVSKLKKEYGNLQLDTFESTNNHFNINYIQNIGKFKFFNNMLKFKVFEDGTMEILFTFYKKIDTSSEKKDIYSADEALYTFVSQINLLLGDEKIIIEGIDLGYLLKSVEQNIYSSILPYYRIYIKDIDTPFYINAYTNTFEYITNIS